jgi:dynein heavy chain
MSKDLDDLSTALFNGELPAMWRKMTSQTEKMLSTWMIWFLRRYAQYIDWAENGEPKVMWLSGLHIPETYIAALVQTACRDRGWPLDRSTTYTQVTKYTQVSEIEEKPRDGCYITGLYLEGASWDEKISMLRVQVQRSTHTHTHTHTQQTHKNISKVMFLSSLSSSSSSSSSSSQHNN